MSHTASFLALLNHKWKFSLFLFSKLPSAYFSGVRVVSATEQVCSVSVPYKWFSQNPFKSTYFACLAMAGELSTGALGMAHVYKSKPAVSMLVIGMEAKYFKKATSKTIFTCSDGDAILKAINESRATGEGRTVKTIATGKNAAGDLIAEFYITWSFKVKS